jgi:hypothetical protein
MVGLSLIQISPEKVLIGCIAKAFEPPLPRLGDWNILVEFARISFPSQPGRNSSGKERIENAVSKSCFCDLTSNGKAIKIKHSSVIADDGKK